MTKPEFHWHLGDRLVASDEPRPPRGAQDRDVRPALVADRGAGTDGVVVPLWKRVLTGRSFRWRIRRSKNRLVERRRHLAGRVLGYLK
ncbi:hypothetical protein, partial [Ilumatobacter sp.]|uniref:hypothetical protein n=1 Tax=Ilumatobacter sp. TaxID=1967498 RepID=UPI003C355B86